MTTPAILKSWRVSALRELSIEIAKMLDAFSDEVVEAVETSAKEAGRAAVNELKRTSPKDRPKYYAGWGLVNTVETVGAKGVTVVNKTHPGLTHLLEHGHALRSGGRTRAQPHIAPAEKTAIEKFEDGIRRRVGG